MPVTKQRVAKIIKVVARVIGLSVTAFLLLASIIILNYGKLGVGDILVLVSFGIALAGCIVSWWRELVAGILFLITAVALLTSVFVYRYYPGWQGAGLTLFVVGVLFLTFWWLSRRTKK